ncbi:hypothetical protein IWQ55_000638 [Labrenzia sp. EL_208]|uniref:hypothetical protein n=1 Tax=Roseibium album TaxID=311410 RepID=UPI0018CAE2DB|nr:hypothetical protein [Labrenzia sp. EL_132]MBG6227446.1 hypothetical protein [Labrenzia sp. EL_208]
MPEWSVLFVCVASDDHGNFLLNRQALASLAKVLRRYSTRHLPPVRHTVPASLENVIDALFPPAAWHAMSDKKWSTVTGVTMPGETLSNSRMAAPSASTQGIAAQWQ